MTDIKDRLPEILGVLAITVSGFVIPIQSWLFTSGLIPLLDVAPSDWVSSVFHVASWILFGVSAISSVVWYFMAVQMSRTFAPKDTRSAMVRWWAILLLPLLSLIGNLWVFGNTSTSAFPWFVGFLLLNMILMFWLSTALSTPPILAHVVPLAPRIRSALRID